MSKLFTINKEQLKKAGIKLVLVLLAGVATYLESYIPGVLNAVVNNPMILTIVLAGNTALIDLIRKFISDEEGNLGGTNIKIS